MPATIEGHGIRARPPDGWSGRLFRRSPEPPDVYPPHIHAGNFAIPVDDSGFGARLTGEVKPGRLSFVYVEYATDDVLRPGEGLYEQWGLPPEITVDDFNAETLLVMRDGHLGMQAFFTVSDTRLGVLYLVLYGHKARDSALKTANYRALEEANHLLDSFEFASSPEQEDFRPARRRRK